MNALLERVVGFGRELREAGLGVTSLQLARFVHALPHVGIDSPEGVRTAARTTLATSRDESAIVDEVFDRIWLQRTLPRRSPLLPSRPLLIAEVAIARRLAADRRETARDVSDRTSTWSRIERLRRKHFDRLTPEEADEVRRLLERAAWPLDQRRTRRFKRARAGEECDWRRTIREAVRLGGELGVYKYRTRATRPRPMVLLVDVSGSMERFARVILTFVHVLASRARRARRRTPLEVFLFGTRLTRVTRAFTARGPDVALASVAREVADWAGGTRIGDALYRFNHQWARRVLRGGPLVVIVSDGWDHGDAGEIAQESAHLSRACHRLVWIHPLAGTAGFEPRTRGLTAALPFVDALLPGGTLEELEDAARYLARLSGVAYRNVDSIVRPSSSALDARGVAPRQVRQPPSGRRL